MAKFDAQGARSMEVIASTPPARRAGLPTRYCQRIADHDEALLTLGLELKHGGYRFTAVTPTTHARVNVRKPTLPPTREDILGWNRSFSRGDLPAPHVRLLAAAGELAQSGRALRSRVRFSTLANQLFVHSAYPTDEADAVFFGPDTYRFARLIRQSLPERRRHLRLLDIGAGSGAGGLYAAALRPNAFASIVLSDVNARALRFSRINALINKVENVETVESNLFENIVGFFDVIVTNPPYLVDPLKRMYRHGGGLLGSELTLQIVKQSLQRLAPGGRLIIYSGSAITRGVDQLKKTIGQLLKDSDFQFEYEEIDPDVFGEELDRGPYDRADRIAAIGLTVDRVH
jgi:methylase of polypeptide subunit release factors